MYSIIILATALLTSCPDGTLLIIEGGNRIVESETDSPYTHIAIIFNIDDEPWVFEADKPRVRKVRLSEYIREVEKQNVKKRRQIKLWLMKPKILFDDFKVLKMRSYLKSQMGREYSIWSYINGRVGDGIHCAELITRTLNRGGIVLRGNPCVQVPVGVMRKIQGHYCVKEKIIHYVKGEAKPCII